MPNDMERMQYTVALKNEPGQIGRVAQKLAERGISVMALCAETNGDVGFVRFVTEGSANVLEALKDLDASVCRGAVFCVPAPERPQGLAQLMQMLALDGININTLYGAAAGERRALVLATDHRDRARRVLAALSEGLLAARG